MESSLELRHRKSVILTIRHCLTQVYKHSRYCQIPDLLRNADVLELTAYNKMLSSDPECRKIGVSLRSVKWCVCDSITLQTLFSCVTRMYYTSEKYFHHYINWLLSTPSSSVPS